MVISVNEAIVEDCPHAAVRSSARWAGWRRRVRRSSRAKAEAVTRHLARCTGGLHPSGRALREPMGFNPPCAPALSHGPMIMSVGCREVFSATERDDENQATAPEPWRPCSFLLWYCGSYAQSFHH